MSEDRVIRQTIIGDEFLTFRPEDERPWSQKFYAGLKTGLLGYAVTAFIDGGMDALKETEYIKDHCLKRGDKDFTALELERIPSLVESINKKGIDERADHLLTVYTDEKTITKFGPISLNIMDSGEFDVFDIPDGFHRMTIAACLGLPFTAYVMDRGANWNKLRIHLHEKHKRKYLYQPIPHPDFDNWEIGHGSPARFDAISTFVETNNLGEYVLDIGCNYGYLLYYLRNQIKAGKGIDMDWLASEIARRLLPKVGFGYQSITALDFMQENQKDFSCVFAVSLLYHLFETNTIDETKIILRKIGEHSRCLIFDDAPHYQNWPSEVTQDGLAAFVQKHTGFQNAEKIGFDDEFGRQLWAAT
jgi:SAM-dependent methyltransferase